MSTAKPLVETCARCAVVDPRTRDALLRNSPFPPHQLDPYLLHVHEEALPLGTATWLRAFVRPEEVPRYCLRLVPRDVTSTPQ